MIRPVVLCAALCLGSWAAVQHNPLTVLDGDTIRIGPTRYRLATIDAPELFNPRCPLEETLAILAKQRLYELTRGDYSLTHVPCAYRSPGERSKDRYGRTCVILKIPPDWEDVGDTLIAEGLAVPFRKGQKPEWCAKRP